MFVRWVLTFSACRTFYPEHMTRQKRMRCRRCMWYNYNFLSRQYEEGSFCGLHGMEEVIPDAPQMALLHTEEPDCGYYPKQQPIQLELQF